MEEAKERIAHDCVDASISEGSDAVRPLSHTHRKVGILSPSKLTQSFNILKILEQVSLLLIEDI